MTIKTIDYELVEFIPEQLEDGILYISEPYNTAAHKCCCGCGEEVITPLNPTDWSVKFTNGKVSLFPSIGNWSFACRSHYWVRGGQVLWSYDMSEEAIQRGRDIDRKLKEQYFEDINRDKGAAPSWTARIGNILKALGKWLKK
tara:strand:- start:2213 stop:2641 length:429 start_codon:yes stop_codon:yes gene_type:complete